MDLLTSPRRLIGQFGETGLAAVMLLAAVASFPKYPHTWSLAVDLAWLFVLVIVNLNLRWGLPLAYAALGLSVVFFEHSKMMAGFLIAFAVSAVIRRSVAPAAIGYVAATYICSWISSLLAYEIPSQQLFSTLVVQTATVTIALAIALTIRNANLGRRRAETQLTQLLERQRKALTHELHDSVGHAISELITIGERAAITKDESARADLVAHMLTRARSVQHEFRFILAQLREPQPDEIVFPSFSDALTVQCQRLQAYGFRVTCETEGSLALPEPITRVLNRVLAESVENIRKHAAPNSHAQFVYYCNPEYVELSIISDLRPKPVSGRLPGVGLDVISERLAAIGGQLDVGHTDTLWINTVKVPLS